MYRVCTCAHIVDAIRTEFTLFRVISYYYLRTTRAYYTYYYYFSFYYYCYCTPVDAGRVANFFQPCHVYQHVFDITLYSIRPRDDRLICVYGPMSELRVVLHYLYFSVYLLCYYSKRDLK